MKGKPYLVATLAFALANGVMTAATLFF